MSDIKFTSDELHQIAKKVIEDIKEKTGDDNNVTQLVLGMCDNIIKTEALLIAHNAFMFE